MLEFIIRTGTHFGTGHGSRGWCVSADVGRVFEDLTVWLPGLGGMSDSGCIVRVSDEGEGRLSWNR